MHKYLLPFILSLPILAGINLLNTEPVKIRVEAKPEYIQADGFTDIRIDGAHYSYQQGHPSLPVFREYIQIPEGAEIAIHTKEKISKRAKLVNPVKPVMPMSIQGQNPSDDYEMYPIEDRWINDEPVGIIKRVKIHGTELALIEFRPVAYNPYWGDIRLIAEMEITIEINGGQRTPQRYRSPMYHKILSDISLTPLDFDPVMDLPIGYLVLCPSDYRLGIQPLLNWRRQLGYHVMVFDPDSFGASASAIKGRISDIYHDGEVVPQYLVIVGDVDVCPTFPSGGSSSETDIDYGVVDGDDYIPDLMTGRISGNSSVEVPRIAERIVEYEKLMYEDTSFTNRVLFGLTNDGSFHDVVHRCHSYCWNEWLEPLGVEHRELDGYVHTMDDVVDALDYGYTFYYYYGHGSSAGLDSPRLDFSGIDMLSNGGKYPLMVGNACSTNEFMREESWGEALLRREGRGAINYMGASEVTYWWPDSVWEIETFRAMYELEYQSAMSMFYYALVEVDIAFPSYGHYFFDVYNMVGDPATAIWAFAPNELTVSHPEIYELSDSTVISVGVESGGAPLEDALICILSGDEQYVLYSDTEGNATFGIPVASPDTMILTVSRRGHIPYSNTIAPFLGGMPYLYISDFSYNDSDTLFRLNNGDGLLDAGERSIFEVTISNYGTDAEGTELNIVSEPLGLDELIYIGDLAEGVERNVQIPVTVPFHLEDGSMQTFDIEITDADTGSWIYNRQMLYNAPLLELVFNGFSDAAMGDGDNIPEVGETIEISVGLVNSGGRAIEDISVILSETSEFLVISDTLQIISSVEDEAVFDVEIISEIPEATEQEFRMQGIWEELIFSDIAGIYLNPGTYSTEIVWGEYFDVDGWKISEDLYQSPPYAFQSTSDSEIFYSSSAYKTLHLPETIFPWNGVISFWYKVFTPLYPVRGDNGFVMIVSEGDTFTFENEFKGRTWEWEHAALEIPLEYQGRQGQIIFGFLSNGENERLGWLIDDIKIASNNEPTMGNPRFTPIAGFSDSDVFTFEFTSSNISEMNIVIDGISYAMTEMGSDSGYTVWQYSTLLESGICEYHFFGDGIRYPESEELKGPHSGILSYFEDFEDGDGDLETSGTDEWQYTESMGYMGSWCWSTLGPEFTGYELEAHSILQLTVDLSESVSPILIFMGSYEFATGGSTGMIRDGGNIKVMSGSDTFFPRPEPFYDGQVISDSNPLSAQPVFGESTSDGWREYSIDLSEWEGEEIELQFHIGSNNISNATGWFIDNIAIYQINNPDGIQTDFQRPQTPVIAAWPNPFNGAVQIDVPSDVPFTITDVSGKTVADGQGPMLWSPNDEIRTGMYIIKTTKSSRKILYIK